MTRAEIAQRVARSFSDFINVGYMHFSYAQLTDDSIAHTNCPNRPQLRRVPRRGRRHHLRQTHAGVFGVYGGGAVGCRG